MTLIGKTIIWLAGWVTGLLVSFTLVGALYLTGGAGASEVPVADLKLANPPGTSQAQTVEALERIILSRGYKKQADPTLVTQDYTRGDFTLSYQADDDAQRALQVVYIYFYEGALSSIELFSSAIQGALCGRADVAARGPGGPEPLPLDGDPPDVQQPARPAASG